MYISRSIEHEVRDILEYSRAGAILGPRQCGKSTLASRLHECGLLPGFYSLDDQSIREAALRDPEGFIADLTLPAVIDEVQRAPEIMLPLKQTLDGSEQRGRFLLTGSANLVTMSTIADALPGRVEYVNLWPFSQGELRGRGETFLDRLLAGEPPRASGSPKGKRAYAETVMRGGFPEVRERPARQRTRYFESYVRTVAGRDMADVGATRTAPEDVVKLVDLLAVRSGTLLNLSSLARDLRSNDRSVARQVARLEELFLVLALRPWSSNLGNRVVKTPKIYLVDSGMAAALAGVDEERFVAPDAGGVTGQLLETFVVTELIKQQTWSDSKPRLYFYRDSAGREVDIVAETRAGEIACVEVKAASSSKGSDARGIRYLAERLGDRFKAGVVLNTGSATVPLGERIWAAPIESLWA